MPQNAVFLAIIFPIISVQLLVLNQNILEHIAGQLSLDQCRQLVASLRSNEFELPKDLKNRERLLNQDLSCGELLEEWTHQSSKRTPHTLLERRLSQLNQSKLAWWVGKEILSGLAYDFQHPKEATKGEVQMGAHLNMLVEDKKKRDILPEVEERAILKHPRFLRDALGSKSEESLESRLFLVGAVSVVVTLLCFLIGKVYSNITSTAQNPVPPS